MINRSLKNNRMDEVETLTKVYALLYSAYAETAFLKIIHTPYGFSDDYIQQIQSASNLETKWLKCLEFATSNLNNKGDVANKLKWLTCIMEKYIVQPSKIRNKIAHGQWKVCLNSKCTAENEETTEKILKLDYTNIDRLFNIYKLFSECVEDLIESPHKAHYRDFYSKYTELQDYIEKTDGYSIEKKKQLLQASPKYMRNRH